ncbi:hypothetical protein LTR97_012185 [Elasticomyces elasticus]|uniref:F-box domain-containing protein n=1 Tax=Elasticomyces elasticus TaxID=574655 RepID=A0AAN7W0Q5_9PEZI|nr:hypothetical protein LTR97_012185 [Elasticomyces elasticus]
MATVNRNDAKSSKDRLGADIHTDHNTAATRLFCTFELCEMIFEHLSAMDLVHVRGVNHVTKAVIANSHDLQQRLFFEPIPNSQYRLWGLNYWGNLIADDQATMVLEVTTVNDNPRAMPLAQWCRVGSEIREAISPHIVNNVLLHHSPAPNSGSIMKRAYNFVHHRHLNRPGYYPEYIFIEPSLLEKALSPHASCRGMYLSQPPVQYVRLEVYERCTANTQTERDGKEQALDDTMVSRVTIGNPTGLTFGEVFDRLCYELNCSPGDSYGYLVFEDGLPVSVELKARVEAKGRIDPRRA